MVKECVVKLNNECVTVVNYGNTEIQFPAIHRKAKTIFVNCEDGKYSVVDKKYASKSDDRPKKKNTEKKTTIETDPIENSKNEIPVELA